LLAIINGTLRKVEIEPQEQLRAFIQGLDEHYLLSSLTDIAIGDIYALEIEPNETPIQGLDKFMSAASLRNMDEKHAMLLFKNQLKLLEKRELLAHLGTAPRQTAAEYRRLLLQHPDGKSPLHPPRKAVPRTLLTLDGPPPNGGAGGAPPGANGGLTSADVNTQIMSALSTLLTRGNNNRGARMPKPRLNVAALYPVLFPNAQIPPATGAVGIECAACAADKPGITEWLEWSPNGPPPQPHQGYKHNAARCPCLRKRAEAYVEAHPNQSHLLEPLDPPFPTGLA
jgi:hypothetical protein